MSPVKSNSTKWEMEFVGEPIAELSDDHLPTLGEAFRYFYHHRQTLARNKSQRGIVLLVVTRCSEIWKKFGIPTSLNHNTTRAMWKLLTLYKAVPHNCKAGGYRRKKKEALWRRKLDMVFNISAKDAMEKSSRRNKRLLKTMEEEAEKLENFERNWCWKRTFTETEIPAVSAPLNGINQQRASFKRKTDSFVKIPCTMRICQVLLPRIGLTNNSDDEVDKLNKTPAAPATSEPEKLASLEKKAAKSATDKVEPVQIKTEPLSELLTDSDDEVNGQTDSASYQSSSYASSIDIKPEEEEIVPPNLPTAIVKEEVHFDWDENDNIQLFDKLKLVP